ncbi:unnamed protein product, partial [Ectocarpus sp. 8 AP-2014]
MLNVTFSPRCTASLCAQSITQGRNIRGTYVRTGSSPNSLSNCPGFRLGLFDGSRVARRTSNLRESANTNRLTSSISTPAGMSFSTILRTSTSSVINCSAVFAVRSLFCASTQSLA